MRLHENPHWLAVHFPDGRTILKRDRNDFSRLDWEELIYDIEVEPLSSPGHYKAV